MPTLSFELKAVKALAEAAQKSAELHGLSATMEDLFDGSLYPGGEPLNGDGKTEKEEAETFWPSSKRIDTSKLTLQFMLVGDEGVYLVTNAELGKDCTSSSTGQIVYAKGCNPDIDEDYYENKADKFGGDDGSIAFPFDWLTKAIEKNKRVFSISLTKTSIKLNL